MPVFPVPPVAPPVVIRAFAPAAEAWLPAHRGVDVRARPGQPVVAPSACKVAFTGRVAGRPVLSLRCAGVRLSFEPVRALVTAGSRWSPGSIVGRVAHGGHCDGRCVHWGAKVDGQYVDPTSFLARRAPVLKPRVTARPAAGGRAGPAGTCCGSD